MFGPALQEDQKRRQAKERDELKEIFAASVPLIGGDKTNPETTTTAPSDKAIPVEVTMLTQPSTRQWAWLPNWTKGGHGGGNRTSLLSGESEITLSNIDHKAVKDAVTVEKGSS